MITCQIKEEMQSTTLLLSVYKETEQVLWFTDTELPLVSLFFATIILQNGTTKEICFKNGNKIEAWATIYGYKNLVHIVLYRDCSEE